MKNCRLPYLDYARVFVAYLVIFGHLLPMDDLSVRPYIYAFHMPFFFLVSGLLHKYRDKIQIKKYVYSLLVPFVCWNVLFVILKPVMAWYDIWNGDVSQYTSFIDYFVDYCTKGVNVILSGKNGIDGPTWFLFALFWCKLGTDFIIKNRYFIVIYLILYFVSLFVHNFVFIRQACMALPFYYIGFYIKNNGYDQIIQKTGVNKKIWISVCLLICSLILTKFNGRVSMVGGRYGDFPKYISFWIFYLNGFIGSFSVLFISSLFKENRWITLSAISLITILCAQNIFIYTFKHMYGWWHYIYNELWIALVILILCVIIHYFLDKYIPLTVGKGSYYKNDK